MNIKREGKKRDIENKVSSAGSENYIIFHNNDGWDCEVEIYFFHISLLRSANALICIKC